MQNPTNSRFSKLETGGRPRLDGPYVELDLRSIEARAHRARAEYLAGLLRSFWAWLERDAQRARQRRIEHEVACRHRHRFGAPRERFVDGRDSEPPLEHLDTSEAEDSASRAQCPTLSPA